MDYLKPRVARDVSDLKITREAIVLWYKKGKNLGKNVFYVRCALSALYVFFLFTRMYSCKTIFIFTARATY